MKRLFYYLLLPLLALLTTTAERASAQDYQVVCTIADSFTRQPLANATVAYTIDKRAVTTKSDGSGRVVFELHSGTTTVKVSHLGYQGTSRMVVAQKKRQRVKIWLKPTSAMLGEVVVVRTPIAIQRGDTTYYKASDFKVNIDANVNDMLLKIPGVEYRDKKWFVHGIEVKEITVDNRKYYENDVNMAVKNLPANILDRIGFYEQLSENAKLTGFDDGNRSMTINLKTKEGTAHSRFGRGIAGGGIDEVYKLYAMYNQFDDARRWSLFAQWNNINEQNFSMIDLLSATGTASSSAPSQSPYSKGAADNTFHPTTSDDISAMMVDVSDYGVTRSQAAGTNFSDEWAKGKMKFTGHYLFNNSSNHTDYHILDNYFGKSSDNDLTDNLQQMSVANKNLNHRFSSKYEYQISPSDYLQLRPAMAYQKKDETARLDDWTVTPSQTDLLLNQLTRTDQYVARTNGEAMFMHKFDTLGHILVADVRASYMHTHEDIGMDFANVQTDDDAQQNTMAKNTQQSYTYMLSYIHPFGKTIRLKLDAGWNKTYGLMRRKTEMNANGAGTFSIDSLLSGSTWSNFGGMLFNLSYMMNYRKMNLVAGTEYQVYDLHNANDRYYFDRSYKTFLPYAIVRLRLSRGQLLMQYRASHNYPGLAQVHDAINNANAVMAIRGSIRLEPAYQHNLMARLILPFSQNGSVFVFFTNLSQADNYIGSLRSLASDSYVEDGERRNTEILSYKNTDGFFSWTSLMAYGVHCKPISSNVNLSTRASYTRTPGYWDNIKQFNNQWNWSGSITVGSNISQEVDFVADVNGKYTSSKNQSFTEMNVSYWALSYGGQLNWQFTPQLKVVLECGRTNYFGSGTSQFNAVISNIALAYKFLRGRKGEIRFQINDLFDQDNSFYQTTTELYRREVTTNILGRYAMLSFTYNLNTNR